MKKSIKNTIIALALSAVAFCFMGGVIPFMNKTNASAATAYYTLDGFKIEETAAVRTKDFNGIRFTTNLSAKTIENVNTRLTDVKYGTLLIPADMLGVEELTHETAKVAVAPAEIWQDADTYTAVLAGDKDASGNYTSLPESYYNRPIAARSYVTGKDGAGNTVTYYSENTAVRSIGYVAKMAKLDGNESEFVGNIADNSKVELVFDTNEQISAAQGTQDGTVIVENKYDSTTDKAAVIKVGGIPLSKESMKAYGIVIAYESSASDVISVSGQTLTAIKVGEATITATATFNGKQLSATKTMSTNAYRGQSEYKILISEAAANGQTNKESNYRPAASLDANAAYQNAFEKTAAYKLQSILEEATGVRLEIVTTVEAGQKYISVGKTALSSAINFSVTKDTGYEVVVDGDNILICGLKEQGTLYGVQNLLKELVGYNFFMEDTYTVNSNVEVVLNGNQSIDPDLEYNVLQGDLNGNGVGDEYAIQMYTEGVIPMGTSDWEDANGHVYKGIAHNTVWVVSDGAYNTTKYEDTSKETWHNWYATYTKTTALIFTSTQYRTMDNPYYTGTDNENTAVDESKKTIKAELCYTAHGDVNARNAMIESVAKQMLEKMQNYPAYERIGFAHMDHRYWCECSTCKKANPSDNLLEFLLDVAANLMTKLANAGDARAETFQICSLFYHATAATPKNTANYATKISTYLKHVEPWLCDSGMDHVDPYKLTEEEKITIKNNNGNNNWNATMYAAIEFWGNLCKANGADMFFWDYYQNTTSFFIPYNVFNTLRRNYGTFAEFEYDYVFSQMMESKQNFARFKEFLISKLKWNANPTDIEWEGWYQEYFEGAYGPGAIKMREYFNKWDAWTTDHINDYRRDGKYDWKAQTGTAALGVDVRTWTDKLTVTELEGWIASIDAAIEELNVNNPKYDTYRRNIMLEKLTPMYLLMWMHDGYTPVKDEKNLPWPYIDPNTPGSFKSTTYVNKYGAEFLTWVAEWNIIRDGEGNARVLKPFLDAIKSKGVQEGDVAINKVIEEKQFVEVASSATFTNTALANETYTVNGGVSGTVTAKGGVVTLNTNALTVGQSYELTFTNTATGGVIVFTNVVAVKKLSATAPAVSGNDGYYMVDETYYVEEGKTQLVLTHKVFTKGDYTLVVGEETSNVSVYVEGKLTVEVGALANGQSRQVTCVDANNNTYEFKVVSAKFIRTAEELKVLGVGGGVKGDHSSYTEEGVIYGNGNSGATGADVLGYYVLAGNIDCSDVVFAAGYNFSKHYFRGTLNGRGYTLSNVTVAEGGIFGGMYGATITNVNFTNVSYLATYPSGTKGYNNNTQYGQYFGLFAHSATNLTVSNVNVQISVVKYANLDEVGLFVDRLNSGTFTNINVDASGCTFKTLISKNHSDANVYKNVVIKAAGYDAIAYDTSNVALTEFPAGITFKKVTKSFEITSTVNSIVLGESLTITTSQPSYSYTYALKEAVSGVSISGNTVNVSNNAKPGATFTVVVTEAEGCVREIAFTIIGENIVVDIDVASGNFTLPNEVQGRISKVVVDGVQLTDINGKKVSFSNQFADKTLHGLGKEIVIYTDLYTYTGTANVITKVIKTAEELKALGVGNNRTNTEDILGYYVLGNDITFEHASDYSDVVTAGYPLNDKYYFKATFDGRGYTLYNMRVSDGGIFGLMSRGTVKNLNLKNVYLTDDIPAGISTQNGGYMAIFAYSAPSTVFENINITIASSPNEWSWKRDGLIVNSSGWGAATYRDITIDATGLKLKTLLGTHYKDSNVYENVVITAADYVAIGYTADSYNNGVQNTAALMSEFPAGVTFERAYLITDGNGVAKPLYEGDVTALGFPAGTKVSVHTAPSATGDNIWSVMGNKSNQVLLRKDADEDYASIQFVLGRDFTDASTAVFFAWMHAMVDGTNTYAAGGWLYRNGSTGASTETQFNAKENGYTYSVFEANSGKFVSDSNPIKAGLVYTLQVYCPKLVDVELATYAISGQPMTIYFANISSGSVIDLAEELTIGVEDGNFVLPTGVEGNVKSVILNGKNIFAGMDGAKATFNKSLMPTAKADLGNKEILIYTDAGIYRIEAVVATQIIRTTQELRDLGVGGTIYTDRKPTYNNSDSTDPGAGGNANSGVMGNDKLGYYVLGNDLDFTGEQSVAAGYCWQQSWFKGTFDGNGHTIYNISVNEGGIFGSLRGATIKNVNFVGVVYNINLGIYAGQYSQQTALFAHVSDSSTFENINVKVASVIPGSFGWATLAYTFWNTNTLTNININASGIALSSVLGSDNQSKVTYNNVTVQAASYTEIGKKGGTVLTEFPAGVTYTQNTASAIVKLNDNKTSMPYYTGDVTALGFANGTAVQYLATKDGYADAYTKAGDTANSRALIPAKADGTATFQLLLSANLESSYLFHIWGVVGTSNSTSYAQVKADGTANTYEGFTISVTDVNGNAVSGKLKANTIYNVTMVAANDPAKGNETGFRLGVLEMQAITLYFANVNA